MNNASNRNIYKFPAIEGANGEAKLEGDRGSLLKQKKRSNFTPGKQEKLVCNTFDWILALLLTVIETLPTEKNK